MVEDEIDARARARTTIQHIQSPPAQRNDGSAQVYPSSREERTSARPLTSSYATDIQMALPLSLNVELDDGAISFTNPQEAPSVILLVPTVNRLPFQATISKMLQPGSAGYSIDAVRSVDQRITWRLWDDALDQVIGAYLTEREALTAANLLSVSEPTPWAQTVQTPPIIDLLCDGIGEEINVLVFTSEPEARVG